MTEIQKFLFENRDEKYRSFNAKLIPTVQKERIIGVRAPVLKAKAKQMYSSGEYESFFTCLPHTYLEENSLHGYILCLIKDEKHLLDEIERFLPYVDNWATCDIIRPAIFKRKKTLLLEKTKEWILSDRVYTVRFAIGMLMSYYLDEFFQEDLPFLVAGADSEEYYISMMVAWYFATALCKQYASVIGFITEKRLSVPTHNRAIQKAVESYRISDEQKEYLKKFRIKN